MQAVLAIAMSAAYEESTNREDAAMALCKNPLCIVRWNDPVHQSVSRRDDGDAHNGPPAGVARIDDAGHEVGRFAR